MSAELIEVPSLRHAAQPASAWTAAPDRVDIWRVDLASVAPERLEALSAAERERAARTAKHRGKRAADAFGPSRAALREILSRYVGAPAAALEIAIGEHGRPRLAGDSAPPLDFNLSHTGDRALVAIASRRSVGIDLEIIDPSRDVRALAGRFFTEREFSQICSDTGDHPSGVRAFYRMWTCKEAYLKAIGTGFSRSPRSFEVTLEESTGRAAVDDRERPQLSGVSLFEFEAAADVAASLCVVGPAARLRVFDSAELVR